MLPTGVVLAHILAIREPDVSQEDPRLAELVAQVEGDRRLRRIADQRTELADVFRSVAVVVGAACRTASICDERPSANGAATRCPSGVSTRRIARRSPLTRRYSRTISRCSSRRSSNLVTPPLDIPVSVTMSAGRWGPIRSS